MGIIIKGSAVIKGAVLVASPASSNDPYADQVVFDWVASGSAGSTSFTDSKNSAIYPSGDVVMSGTQSAYGTTAAYFDGSGDYLTAIVTDGLGTGAFTVEILAYVVSHGYFFNSRGNGTGSDGMDWHTSGQATTGGSAFLNNAVAGVQTGQWQLHTITREANGTVHQYVDKVERRTGTISNNFSNSTLRIGGSPEGNVGYMTGYIQRVRVTRGAARTSEQMMSMTDPNDVVVETPPETTVPEGSFRYARILVTAVDGNTSHVGFSEIELFDTNASLADLLDSGGPYTYTQSGDGSVGGASAATDNNQMSESGSSFPLPYWWEVDFGSGNEKPITSVSIRSQRVFPNRTPKDFKLQVSNDRGQWSDILSVTGSSGWSEFEVRRFNS